MTDLRGPELRALELLEHGPRPDNELPAEHLPALAVLIERQFVSHEVIYSEWSKPRRPTTAPRSVTEIVPGNFISLDGGNTTCRVTEVRDKTGGVNPGVHVLFEGGHEPAVWRYGSRVEVYDGPILHPVETRVYGYRITKPGLTALTRHRWNETPTDARVPAAGQPLPPEGAKLREGDVPPEFRDGGRPDGPVLTAPYLEGSPCWLLKGPYLTKHYGPGKELSTHIKVGPAKAYLYAELLVLRDRKAQNDDKRDR